MGKRLLQHQATGGVLLLQGALTRQSSSCSWRRKAGMVISTSCRASRHVCGSLRILQLEERRKEGGVDVAVNADRRDRRAWRYPMPDY